MPTYEYKCTKCGYDFEAFQSMHEDPLKTCEKCGGELRKVFGRSTGIIFKGSGFYVNDYKKDKSPACEDCSCSHCHES